MGLDLAFFSFEFLLGVKQLILESLVDLNDLGDRAEDGCRNVVLVVGIRTKLVLDSLKLGLVFADLTMDVTNQAVDVLGKSVELRRLGGAWIPAGSSCQGPTDNDSSKQLENS